MEMEFSIKAMVGETLFNDGVMKRRSCVKWEWSSAPKHRAERHYSKME